MGQVVITTRARAACDQPAVRFADVEQADTVDERGVQLPPEFVGALHERYVTGVLVVHEPDDPCLAVHRAAVMRDPELLEPEYPAAPASEVVQGGAALRAAPPHHGVVPPIHTHRAPLVRILLGGIGVFPLLHTQDRQMPSSLAEGVREANERIALRRPQASARPAEAEPLSAPPSARRLGSTPR